MFTPWFWALVASAGLFAALYLPAIAHWSRALASPYAKADVHRRMAAATLDGLLTLSCVVFYLTTESVLPVLAGAGYALLRDAVGGQSVGKFVYSLMVIRLDTGRPAGAWSSVRRNIVLLIPGANVLAVFLEALTVVRDPKGARLGDRIALTQVVDGFGAREFVKILRDQLTVETLRSAGNTKPFEEPVHPVGHSTTARPIQPTLRLTIVKAITAASTTRSTRRGDLIVSYLSSVECGASDIPA